MKIIKNDNASLLLKTFSQNGKDFLAISVLSLIDLNTPDIPEPEQQLWKLAGSELEKHAVLDLGMPKPVGEVLLQGNCYTPNGFPRHAQPVSFSVGSLHKELYVFGSRNWQSLAGITQLTKPQPFTNANINWRNAFGGSEYAYNPLGTGIDNGALPLVEYPDQLIGSPSDRPTPAGFGPVDAGWKPRAERAGTYDATWLNAHWPAPAPDLDWRYYNAAPADQWIDDFFSGGEDIYIKNMHPTKPRMTSRIPQYRQRVLLLGHGDPLEAPLREAETKLDTLWLFPHKEKAILIHRAVSRVHDDEASDIAAVFIRTEQQHDIPAEPISLREEIAVRISRAVPVDENAKDTHSEAFAKGNKQLEAMDAKVDTMLKQSAGGGELPSPKAMAEVGKTSVAQGLAQIDGGIAQLAAVQSRWGHLAPISTKPLHEARKKLLEASTHIANGCKEAQAAQEQASAAKNEAMQTLKDEGIEELLAEHGKGLEDFTLPPEELRWQRQAYRFVVASQKNLTENNHIQSVLQQQGICPSAAQNTWLGYHSAELTISCKEWGITKENEPSVVIPSGVICPRFVGHQLVAVSIHKPENFSSAHPLEGSQPAPMQFAVNKGEPIFVTATEIDTIILHHALGFTAGVICLPKPEHATPLTKLLESCPRLFVCILPSQQPATGELIRWQKLCPHAELLVVPWEEGLQQAAREEKDIRDFFLPLLLQNAKENDSAASPKGNNAHQAKPSSIATKASNASKKSINADLNAADAKMQAGMEKAHEELSKLGISRGILYGENENDASNSGLPDILTVKAPQNDNSKQPASASATKHAELTQQQAIAAEAQAHHNAGGSLKGLQLNGADFSGLDLSGADFSNAQLEEAIFCNAVLDHANFAGARMADADFSQSSLTQSIFDKALLHSAVFIKAKAENSSFTKAILTQANMSEANLNNVNFDDAVMDETLLKGCSCQGATFNAAVILSANLDNADFTGAILDNVFIKAGSALGTTFSSASMLKSSMQDLDATGAIFTKADMTNTRGGQQSSFRHADFSGALLTNSYWEFCDFAGATFAGCIMNEAGFEQSTMQSADMRQIEAKHSIFSKSDLSNALLRGANLFGANLRKTKLSSADLTGASLFGADLYKAVLDKTKFTDTNCKRTLLEKRQDVLTWTGMQS